MQDTDAIIITSLVSNNDNVAECLNLSISSFIEASFQCMYQTAVYMLLVDSNRNMKQNTPLRSLGRTL